MGNVNGLSLILTVDLENKAMVMIIFTIGSCPKPMVKMLLQKCFLLL